MGINSGWFFGDSFLYGYQCHPGDPYYEVSNNKDKRIASQIICDKLKLKHFNLSQYGFSNGNIIHTIFKNIKKIKEGDLVVILDSHSVRTPLVYSHKDYYNNWPKGSYFKIHAEEDLKTVYRARGTVGEELINFYKDIFRGIVYEFKLRNVKAIYLPTNNTFLNEYNIHKIREDEPSVDDGHWSFNGHKTVADIILNELDKKII